MSFFFAAVVLLPYFLARMRLLWFSSLISEGDSLARAWLNRSLRVTFSARARDFQVYCEHPSNLARAMGAWFNDRKYLLLGIRECFPLSRSFGHRNGISRFLTHDILDENSVPANCSGRGETDNLGFRGLRGLFGLFNELLLWFLGLLCSGFLLSRRLLLSHDLFNRSFPFGDGGRV